MRTRLPTQGTRVRSLLWEDPTCYGVSMCTTATEAATTEAHTPRSCASQQEKSPQEEAHVPQRVTGTALHN